METRSKAYKMAVCALMAALLCVLGPLSVPIGPIPLSLATFVIYLTVFLLGPKLATVSCLVYIALGTAGFPVFTGFQGGLQKLAGPTGGYIVGYLIITALGGIILDKSSRSIIMTILGFSLATLGTYAFGTAWFVFQTHCGVWYALTVCVFPFVVFDLMKITAAWLIGSPIRIALSKNGYI